jgi:antitoxin VapB
VTNELDRITQEAPLRERVAAIRRTIIARGRTGLVADKEFFDDLSGDL